MKHALLLTLLLTFTASAFEFGGKVVGVADGDTITVLFEGKKQYKVRLQHIDCPETRQPFATNAMVKGKCFTPAALRLLPTLTCLIYTAPSQSCAEDCSM
jgi:endonuclease YncB( thermonuclease family)